MREVIVYQRGKEVKKPIAMRFQARDKAILQAIYTRGGVMAKRQLKALFWPYKSKRAFEKRLAKLYQAGYVTWPSSTQWRSKPIPEPIVWLSMQGILVIAAECGVKVTAPSSANENQQRTLENNLRDQGIYWVREPRWSQLEHDLVINDIRLIVEEAVASFPHLKLEAWVHEGVFRSNTDVIEYEVAAERGERKKLKKGVLPDSYFVIVDESRQVNNNLARARFLLEVDLATHDLPSFGREKVLPGIAYILSDAYRERFGDNSGRWLVVTTGERRLQNLKRQTEQVAGKAAGAFFFSIFGKLAVENILIEPIWWQGGQAQPRPLL